MSRDVDLGIALDGHLESLSGEIAIRSFGDAKIASSFSKSDLSLTAEGQILLQTAEVPIADLETKLKTIFTTRTNREVFLRADRRVAYGTVAQALAVLRRAGASRIGMVTEPEA